MKYTLLTLLLSVMSALLLQAQTEPMASSDGAGAIQPTDSIPPGRYVMRSTLFGVGFNNAFDTYLSPLEYTGIELRFLHEGMRMTRLMNNRVSGQHLIQAMFSHTENPARTGEMYTGMIGWSYALHYQYPFKEQWKFLIGPYIDLNAGFIYNRRNSNNPAQAKAYGNIGVSGMAICKFHIGRYPMTVRYQANLPLIGCMFSPEFGESYYEIFELGNHGGHAKFTSLHNQPSIRQMITLDFPVSHTILRVGYLCDIQQAKVNHLKSHLYSHDFLIGFVRNVYLFKEKKRISMPDKLTPF